MLNPLKFFTRKLVTRVPLVGDPVWWAPKQIGCVVTAIEPNGNVVFQGGEIVKNSRGRQIPRWTVAAGCSTYLWDESLQMWIVGQGVTPKEVRGAILKPSPVQLSGQAAGSFARSK